MSSLLRIPGVLDGFLPLACIDPIELLSLMQQRVRRSGIVS